MQRNNGGWKLYMFIQFCLSSPLFLCLDNKVIVAQKGGIDAVVRAMKLHEGVAVVQENGCGALCNISVNAGK
jgi:hypothetical protein